MPSQLGAEVPDLSGRGKPSGSSKPVCVSPRQKARLRLTRRAALLSPLPTTPSLPLPLRDRTYDPRLSPMPASPVRLCEQTISCAPRSAAAASSLPAPRCHAFVSGFALMMEMRYSLRGNTCGENWLSHRRHKLSHQRYGRRRRWWGHFCLKYAELKRRIR